MAANGHYKENREACERLVAQINLMKLKLEAKYGPSIKKQWAGRTRHDPTYELVI